MPDTDFVTREGQGRAAWASSSPYPYCRTRLIECWFGDCTLRAHIIVVPACGTVRRTFDAVDEHSVGQQRLGWQAVPDGFARHIEAGKWSGGCRL
jgi:hypothetical protein